MPRPPEYCSLVAAFDARIVSSVLGRLDASKCKYLLP